MTILKPNNSIQLNLGFTMLIGFVIAIVAANIYVYSGIVNFQHITGNNAKELQAAQVANADLKNSLYKLLDLSNFKAISEELRLVKETKPSFLEIGISVAANQ